MKIFYEFESLSWNNSIHFLCCPVLSFPSIPLCSQLHSTYCISSCTFCRRSDSSFIHFYIYSQLWFSLSWYISLVYPYPPSFPSSLPPHILSFTFFPCHYLPSPSLASFSTIFPFSFSSLPPSPFPFSSLSLPPFPFSSLSNPPLPFPFPFLASRGTAATGSSLHSLWAPSVCSWGLHRHGIETPGIFQVREKIDKTKFLPLSLILNAAG